MKQPNNNPAGHFNQIQKLRKISELLDNAFKIPGTSYGIGIDPILGLIPGGGDLISGILSIYIIYSAAQIGAPRETLVRMVSNIIFDTLAGTIPMFGDLFDVAWKANSKNMDILEAHVAQPGTAKKADLWFIILLLGGLFLIIVTISALTFWGITTLFKWITTS